MDDAKQAVAQAMYDIKPSMTGAQRLAEAIDALIVARLADKAEPKRGPGRPRKDEA